ncbi:MAG TPA: hypothetical protein VFX50_03290, partial [Gemmatimonadales bacterium]|nr:hypothetical protein [Gemmatimonadales bacterium]
MLRSLGGLLLALAACGGDSTAVPSDSVRRVLFVGNSLTAAWELPALVAQVALAAGDTLEVASVTFDGASLDDHLLRGTAEEALRSGRWDVAVFQQGPTSTAEGGAQLVQAMERFAPLVRAAGGRPALYMVWPTQDRVAYWD